MKYHAVLAKGSDFKNGRRNECLSLWDDETKPRNGFDKDGFGKPRPDFLSVTEVESAAQLKAILETLHSDDYVCFGVRASGIPSKACSKARALEVADKFWRAMLKHETAVVAHWANPQAAQ